MEKNDRLEIIGKRIKMCRIASDLSQRELAKRTGYSQAQISKIESGHSSTTLKKIKKIADALQSNTAFLTGDTDIRMRDLLAGDIPPIFFENLDELPPEKRKTYDAICEILKETPEGSMTAEDTADTKPRKLKIPVIPKLNKLNSRFRIYASDIDTWEGETITARHWRVGKTIDETRYPFAIRAEGFSMQGAGISPDSDVIINPAEPVENMDVALVFYLGKYILRKIKKNSDGSYDLLASEGTAYHIAAEEIDTETFHICGRAMCVIANIRHGL